MTDEPDALPTERRFLGIVEVDSGTLLVGDPAYCLPSIEHGKAGIDYSAIFVLAQRPPRV